MYEGENFEMRERMLEVAATCQIMVYPKHMIVNKTSMRLVLEESSGAGQIVRPLSNDYIQTHREKVALSVSGYSSQIIDITTFGVSGVVTLNLESKEEVEVSTLPH